MADDDCTGRGLECAWKTAQLKNRIHHLPPPPPHHRRAVIQWGSEWAVSESKSRIVREQHLNFDIYIHVSLILVVEWDRQRLTNHCWPATNKQLRTRTSRIREGRRRTDSSMASSTTTRWLDESLYTRTGSFYSFHTHYCRRLIQVMWS